jgi:PA14 domain
VLTATDSAGQVATTSVDIQPQTIQITLAASPPGLQLTYGGTTVTAPTTRAAIVGAAYTIGAPSPQALAGATYRFTSWSDGGGQSHTIVAGTSPATYTAAYSSGGGATDCPVGQFKAEHFANRALSGVPATTRCEATIDNQWRDGGPSGVGSDDFSVRWTGRHRFDAGDYTFTAAADDGVRVWLDGALVVDAWRDQPPTQYQATRSVTAGEHEVKVDYYERDGGAVARVSWSPAAAGCQVGHYLAEYYPNRALWGNPAIRRCEATIDHPWGRAGPVPGVGPDGFSVRWTGRHRFDAGQYAFSAVADDGVRVWIDDSPLIDAWRDQGATEYTATRALTAGEHAIRVEYYENGVDAVARFSWEPARP